MNLHRSLIATSAVARKSSPFVISAGVRIFLFMTPILICAALATSCGKRAVADSGNGAQPAAAASAANDGSPEAALAAKAREAREKASRLATEAAEAEAEALRLEAALAALAGTGPASPKAAPVATAPNRAVAETAARPSPAAAAPSGGPAAIGSKPSLQLLDEGRESPGKAALDAVSARPRKKAQPISRNPYRGAIAVDAATGKVLFSEGADVPSLPASMVKMMDLLLVQEAIERGEHSESEMVGVSTRAFKTGGSQVYLDPNESFSLEDMLYALIIQSANDAAVAIAEHMAGSCEEMVRRMNERAAQLGMRDTCFRSVHGLPAGEGQLNDVSTPRDMAILACELCRHPGIFKYTGADFRVFRPAPRLFEMRTHNPLLQQGTKMPGADGLKTGYTSHAGYSIAGSAVRDGRRVVVVLMGVGGPGVDSNSAKKSRNNSLRSIFERAFSQQ